MMYKKKNFHNSLQILTYAVLFTVALCIFSLMLSCLAPNTELTDTTYNESMNEPVIKDIPSEPIILEGITTPVLFSELTHKFFYDAVLTEDYINTVNKSILLLNNAITSGTYSSVAVHAMELERERLYTVSVKMQMDLDKYIAWETEFYYAAKTYEFLKQNGYNDAVACGIIGNMMIETSGGSLNLNPTIYSPKGTYYGLCQWSLNYYPEIRNMSFEAQLYFLLNTIEAEFVTFGRLYNKHFSYDDFMSITDPAEAAYIFAKVYERCSTSSYNLRRQSAVIAYNYFNSNNIK